MGRRYDEPRPASWGWWAGNANIDGAWQGQAIPENGELHLEAPHRHKGAAAWRSSVNLRAKVEPALESVGGRCQADVGHTGSTAWLSIRLSEPLG